MIKLRIALIAFLLSSVQQCHAQTPDLVESSQVNANDLNRVKQAQLPSNPKVGLALGGGGARGAAEVGVMEVFEEEGIKFDIITGTSIGSIIGGLYVAGVPVSTLRKEFESGRAMKHFMPVPLGVGLVLEPLMLTPRLIGKSSFDGIYPGYSFRKYLEKITPENGKEIRSLRIPYAAVCLNLTDGKPYMVRGGSLISAMVASSAVPGLRRPVPFGEKLLCDGGVACNVPVKQCREMGADIVIAVNIDEPFSSMEIDKFRKLESVSKRMLAWDLYTIDKPQEELADVVIHPDTLGVSLITTNRKCAVKAIEAGRQAALKALPEIKKRLADAGIVVAGKTNQISATGSSAK